MRPNLKAVMMAAVVVPTVLFSTRASAQGIAGVWETSVPTRMSNEGGVMTASDPVVVTITIEQRADSVFATWKREAVAGQPAPADRLLKGTFKDGVLTLVAPPTQARTMMNGEEGVVTITTTYSLKLEGDSLVGTSKMTSDDGMMNAEPRDFKATRKKA